MQVADTGGGMSKTKLRRVGHNKNPAGCMDDVNVCVFVSWGMGRDCITRWLLDGLDIHVRLLCVCCIFARTGCARAHLYFDARGLFGSLRLAIKKYFKFYIQKKPSLYVHHCQLTLCFLCLLRFSLLVFYPTGRLRPCVFPSLQIASWPSSSHRPQLDQESFPTR